MSRNIEEANQIIFENIKLKYFCSDDYTDDVTFNNIRYVAGDATEKSWLKDFKLNLKAQVCFWNENSFLLGEFNNQKYLVSVGIEDIEFLPEGITSIPLNAGIFLAVIADLGLMVKKDYPPLKISNEILSQHKNIDGYTGHSLKDLEHLFPTIKIFQIDTSIYGGDLSSLEQLSCIVLTLNKNLLRLPYHKETLNRFRNLLYMNFPNIRYDNLFQALTATKFKFAFLDIYRLIEMLYQLCYITDIERKIPNIERNLLLKTIDSELNWKPNERNSLIKILNNLSISDRLILTKQLPNIIKRSTQQSIVNNEALWNWVYDLRCSIVHLKTYHSDFSITDKDWDTILGGLLEVIIAAYNIYDK